MSAITPGPLPAVDRYVRVSDVAIIGSQLAILTCILALTLWYYTGYIAIDPIIALAVLPLSGTFWFIGTGLQSAARGRPEYDTGSEGRSYDIGPFA